MDFRRAVVGILCLTVIAPLIGGAEARPQRRIDVPAYFVFGDSFADVGTNNYLPNAAARANFLPYGETFFHKPTGRFTNGRNIVDIFAQAVGLPSAPPYLQPNSSFIAGVNFASAGSGLLNETNFDTELYKSGARKAVLVNLAPLGCSPTARASNPFSPGECFPPGNNLALGFNAGVQQLVDSLRFVLPDFNIVIAETYDLISSMIHDKKSYGLDNVNAACCGAGFLNAQVRCGLPMPPGLLDIESSLCKRPSKYLFWDIVHPTEQVVKLLFKSFWTGNSSSAYPMNVKALASL